MPKVSIIMPSLNVAIYIENALSSVRKQTLNDIEILCIDAGSTDGTIEIIRRHASEDDRIRIIESDKRSYGYQMNLGISEAAGEYVGIVETDDFIEPDMYKTLYDTAYKSDADIVKSDFGVFTSGDDGTRYGVPYSLRRQDRVEYGSIYSCDDYITGRVKPECYVWDAIYRRSFLIENGVRFNESPGACFQDFSFRYQTIFNARRIVAVDKIFYHYRRDNTGASTYNPRTVEFNLREAKYTLAVMEERCLADVDVRRALINEITEFAFWPFMEMLKWIEPADSTSIAYGEYRDMLRDFIEKGWLKKETTNPDLWFSTNLLLEGVDVYCGYARVVSRFERERIYEYVNMVKDFGNVIIFGAGVRGNAIFVFLRNSGIRNVSAFCDNEKKRQHNNMYGIEVISPEEAAVLYKDALYILSSPKVEKEMRAQLNELGIDDERISLYPLSVHPLFCTNCSMRAITGV